MAQTIVFRRLRWQATENDGLPHFWRRMGVGAAAMDEEAVERERGRVEFLATLDDARASLARGEGRAITGESMRELATKVRDRGRARLMAGLADVS